MIKNPENAVKEAIDIFPKNIKTFPIPDTTINLSACFNIKTKAFIAEEQKLWEVKATYI